MAKRLMIQGTMSSAGKSLITAGLCRIFHQDGYSVAPFKSQNMSLNSFITRDGLEMGRAQVTQAEAACVEPSALMNPILLKPTSDRGSQVIVRGEVWQTLDANGYYAQKHKLRPVVTEAYRELAEQYDILVIEGAGSPAEINLPGDDFVNMGMAEIADAPVLLVADIDRGGVFAAIYGTVMLLPSSQRSRIRGIIINKFRGDPEILQPGLETIEELTGIPVLGVVPFLPLDIDDEDSIIEPMLNSDDPKPLDVAVIRLPRISNATDFNALARMEPVRLRYVRFARDLKTPDLVILPGTKSTMADLAWLRREGFEDEILRLASAGVPIIGVCGGYQMLGMTISDPECVESGGEARGLELLPVDTVFQGQKTRTRVTGRVQPVEGFFAPLKDAEFEGYEIHMGRTRSRNGAKPFALLSNGVLDGAVCGRVLGSYVHGLFDGEMGTALIKLLASEKGLPAEFAVCLDASQFRQSQYDLLARSLREQLDMERIYAIMDEY